MFKKKLKYVEISILYDKNFSSVRDTDTNYINRKKMLLDGSHHIILQQSIK